jgi:hypothetical protein
MGSANVMSRMRLGNIICDLPVEYLSAWAFKIVDECLDSHSCKLAGALVEIIYSKVSRKAVESPICRRRF